MNPTQNCAGGNATRGFTLVELTVSVALVIVIAGVAWSVAFSSQRFHADQIRQHRIELAGQKIMRRLAQDLREVDPGTVLPLGLTDSDFIQYQKITGVNGGAYIYGPVVTVTYDSENEVVFYTEMGQEPQILAMDVKGLRFNGAANGVSFSADVGVIDSDGQLVQRTFTQEVTFRTSGG